jgi:four helix bundle protein
MLFAATVDRITVNRRFLRTPEAWPLRDQILRATISIPSNIAEGAGRGSNSDFDRFLGIPLAPATSSSPIFCSREI